ncbi:hypothetical protein BDR05DRAFT_975241 [Suillus weaverae]|nr:hypothetical protein BDR05DRAFT_975241 [Suillus weaverae]
MPSANSSKAPSFNGKTSELLKFFKLFEDLATTKCFWVTLTRYESKDFTIFKTSILVQYLGAAKGQRYSICDLKCIIISNANNDISTEIELLQYYRQFCPMAHWLITNGKISM